MSSSLCTIFLNGIFLVFCSDQFTSSCWQCLELDIYYKKKFFIRTSDFVRRKIMQRVLPTNNGEDNSPKLSLMLCITEESKSWLYHQRLFVRCDLTAGRLLAGREEGRELVREVVRDVVREVVCDVERAVS